MPIDQHAPHMSGDPDDQDRPCEYPGCTVVVPQRLAHNLGVVYLHSGGKAPSYQCPQIEHWTCSHEHAVAMAHLCLDEHVVPLLAQNWSHNPERWSHPALTSSYACEHSACGQMEWGEDMHGFVITYRFVGGELNRWFGVRECTLHLGCSPEHAARAAHTCIDEHITAMRNDMLTQVAAANAVAAAAAAVERPLPPNTVDAD